MAFENKDEILNKECEKKYEERSKAGLDGLVGGLQCVVINTEDDKLIDSAKELIRWTGLQFREAYEGPQFKTIVLGKEKSADFIIQSRKKKNPFKEINQGYEKSKHLPNTRLETFVFECKDLKKYYDIQKNRGIEFLNDQIIETNKYLYIQVKPSQYTGNSIGLLEWKDNHRSYKDNFSKYWDIELPKPDIDYLSNVGYLDHVATRLTAENRDSAILELLDLTNYYFDFAIYTKHLNSITNVARLSKDRYDVAMVFTSGIRPYEAKDDAGPTEKFVKNYGPRVHHMAFYTDEIIETFNSIKYDGLEFIQELIGSPEEGLRQAFTKPSENTLMVTEYIQRYGDFDGFFTRSNVEKLTRSTYKQ
jgi:hypothetical protein